MYNSEETVTATEINQELKTVRSHQLHLKFDDKDCLENLLSSEDLLKLEESKSLSFNFFSLQIKKKNYFAWRYVN